MWEIRKSFRGVLGVFATARIPVGTRLFDYFREEMKRTHNRACTYAMRRAWGIIISKDGPGNLVLRRRILHAVRDIEPGEELFLPTKEVRWPNTRVSL